MSIRVICGCMFSGKTSILIYSLQRYEIAKKKVLLIKFQEDTRYDQLKCSTHNHITMDALAVSKLHEVSVDHIARADVIGIDEGQFYPDLIECCDTWANQGKIVIIACLDGTSQRETFPTIASILSKADMIEKVHAVCHFCGKNASFTLELSSPIPPPITTKEEKTTTVFSPRVGGYEDYRAACRSCYNLANIYKNSY